MLIFSSTMSPSPTMTATQFPFHQPLHKSPIQSDPDRPTKEKGSYMYSAPNSGIQMLLLVFLSVFSILGCGVLGVSDDDGLDTLGSGKTPLRMVSGSGFRIALFADLHYGENAWTDWGLAQDVKSDRVMSTVLDSEKPDFVVYLGDVITANNIVIQNASLYWDKALSPTRKRGIPWASVFGNHDDAYFEWPSEWFSATGIPNVNCPHSSSSYSGYEPCMFRGTTRVELMLSEITNNKLTYSINGPSKLWPGVSNYVLQVLSSDGTTPVLFMYFFDSGGGSYPEVISHAQVQWFKQQSDLLNPNAKIPELIFWHIPSTAYSQVAPKPMSVIARPCIGSINKESVASQEADWNITDILTARRSVKAVFVGHNHGLDWCCPYKTLWLCFARHTGYGGYGSWPRGARIIEVTENPFTLRSWIRMEDGSTHSDVIFSS